MPLWALPCDDILPWANLLYWKRCCFLFHHHKAHPFSHHQGSSKSEAWYFTHPFCTRSVKGHLDWKDIGSWLSCWCLSVPPPTSVRILENFWVQSQNAHRHSQTQKNHWRSCKCHSQTSTMKNWKSSNKKGSFFLESLVLQMRAEILVACEVFYFLTLSSFLVSRDAKKLDSTWILIYNNAATVWAHTMQSDNTFPKTGCPSIQKQPQTKWHQDFLDPHQLHKKNIRPWATKMQCLPRSAKCCASEVGVCKWRP